jgi:hypothetical protein
MLGWVGWKKFNKKYHKAQKQAQENKLQYLEVSKRWLYPRVEKEK